MSARKLDRDLALIGFQDRIAQHLEHVVEQAHIEFVVFDDQNALARSGRQVTGDRHKPLRAPEVGGRLHRQTLSASPRICRENGG
jgi:hypothetical protein